ncbi:unnamed protein product [Paramecium sonneborni]|uniref:Transmembrane protein n=1 Tax=Paramecium sonneborni TaxID=65129 RepID=A0A8S1N4I5_9CILI|nr:unnamed protein product [Paramecium sonneborni]
MRQIQLLKQLMQLKQDLIKQIGNLSKLIQIVTLHKDLKMLLSILKIKFLIGLFLSMLSALKKKIQHQFFKNVTYEIETEQKIQEQVNSVKMKMIQEVQIYIGISLLLVILTTSFIRCLSAPLLNLIQLINIHVRKIGNNLDSELFKMSLKTKKQTDVFSSLTYSFLGLRDLQTRRSENKNQTCQQIEDIKYNFNYQEIDCSKIKEQILHLPGLEASEIFKKINSFQKPLLLRSFSQKKLWISTCDETLYRLILIKQIFQQLFQKNSIL